MKLTFALFAAICAMAQAPAPTDPPAGSISGVVRNAEGSPIPDAQVYTGRATAMTDDRGRFTLRNLAPGEYNLVAETAIDGQMGFGPSQSRPISLQAGEDLKSIDFRLLPFGEISGKVLDQNGEPVPAVNVYQVAREYREGALRTVFAGSAATDDRGAYAMTRVMPGRPILLVVIKRELRLPAISAAPADPRLRKKAVVPTFYPDAVSPDSAQVITLRSGEQRTGIDFRLRRAPSYCVEGVLQGGAAPGPLNFEIAPREPTSGPSGNGGFYTTMPFGKATADGRIRVCDLNSGEYAITAWEDGAADRGGSWGTTAVVLGNDDLSGVRVPALPRMTVKGEVVWAGAAPEKTPDAKLSLSLRAFVGGEKTSATATLPGEFVFEDLLTDEYSLDVRGLAAGMYVKDIVYGASSIFHKPLRAGSAIGGSSLRVIVARDGARVSVTAASKDGAPAADVDVTLIPEFAGSDADLAARIISGRTNQNGRYQSGALPPGKYYVLAGNVANDNTPDRITKLRGAKNKAKEIEAPPGGTAQVTVEPVDL